MLLCVVLLCALPIVFTHAETAAELNNKINQKNLDIQKLEQDIKTFQAQLENLGKQKDSLAVSIQELDITKKKLGADISVTQNKIDKTNLKIQGLSKDIGTKEDSITNDLEAIAAGIRSTDESERRTLVELVLSDNDFTAVWNDIDSMLVVRDNIREQIKNLQQVKGELEDTRETTIDAKNELVVLKKNLADQKKIVDQNTAEKNKLLSQTKNSESNYQKLLKDQIAKKLAFEKELRDF